MAPPRILGRCRERRTGPRRIPVDSERQCVINADVALLCDDWRRDRIEN